MLHYHPNDPDTKPAKLADTSFWFEELEPIPGMMLDGCAEIEIDGFGDWTLGSIYIGKWKRTNWREVFVGASNQRIHFNEKIGNSFDPMWELIRKELVRKYDDEITQQCIEEAEG